MSKRYKCDRIWKLLVCGCLRRRKYYFHNVCYKKTCCIYKINKTYHRNKKETIIFLQYKKKHLQWRCSMLLMAYRITNLNSYNFRTALLIKRPNIYKETPVCNLSLPEGNAYKNRNSLRPGSKKNSLAGEELTRNPLSDVLWFVKDVFVF